MRLLVLLLALAAVPARGDTLHVITLRHRPAAQVQPLLRPLLRPDEGMSGTGYQLFLRASESRRREIERLVAALDVAPRQLTITLRQVADREERRARDAVSGEIRLGDRGHVRVAEGGASGNAALRYRGERRSSSTNTMSTQTLRVEDGQRAFIRIGSTGPTVVRLQPRAGAHAARVADAALPDDSATGFVVLPRVRGDTVELQITPRLARDAADRRVHFQELHTTVTAHFGEWVDLGTAVETSSETGRAISQSAGMRGNDRVTFAIKVE